MRFTILLASIALLISQGAYSQMIELETTDDYEKLYELEIRNINIEGEIKGDDSTVIPFIFSMKIKTDGSKFEREVIELISITIAGRTASFSGKLVSRLLYPKLPDSLLIYGLKPNGLLIEFSGPDGAESYRCQIHVFPDTAATIFYQDWFGGTGGGFQKVIKAGTSKFK